MGRQAAGSALPVAMVRDPGLVGRVTPGADQPESVRHDLPGDPAERAAVLQHVDEAFVRMGPWADDGRIPEVEVDDRDLEAAAAPFARQGQPCREAFGIVGEAGQKERSERQGLAGFHETVDHRGKGGRGQDPEHRGDARTAGHRVDAGDPEKRKVDLAREGLWIRVALDVRFDHPCSPSRDARTSDAISRGTSLFATVLMSRSSRSASIRPRTGSGPRRSARARSAIFPRGARTDTA